MEQITYKVISALGRNLIVEYSLGEHTVEFGLDIPPGSTEEFIRAKIETNTPHAHFDSLLNPIEQDAFASLVGLSGSVSKPEAQVSPTQTAIGDLSKIVSFTETSNGIQTG